MSPRKYVKSHLNFNIPDFILMNPAGPLESFSLLAPNQVALISAITHRLALLQAK
jgi:hypothetical protein